MEQQGAASSEIRSKKQRPKPLELQTSLPESSTNNLLLCPAERYITNLSQTMFDQNDTQSVMSSGTSPSVKNSSSTLSNSPLSHAEIMSDWKKKQSDEIHKKKPHQYQYGPSPSSTTRTSPSRMFFKTPTQSDDVDSQVEETNSSPTPFERLV